MSELKSKVSMTNFNEIYKSFVNNNGMLKVNQGELRRISELDKAICSFDKVLIKQIRLKSK